MKRPWFALLVLISLVAVGRPVSAQIMDYNRWKISVTPYFWLSGSKGDLTVDGTANPIDVSFSELSDYISWGISAHVEARKRLWVLIFDIRYRDLDTQENFQSTTLRNTLAEATAGYTVFELRRFKVTGEVLAGLRYSNMKVEVRDAPGIPSETVNWVDPLVGGRVIWAPSKAWTFSARGDVGGFGVGSKLSYNAGLFAGWRVYDFSVIGGYRVWYADYETGSGADLFKYDITTHGPGIGMTFHFGG